MAGLFSRIGGKDEALDLNARAHRLSLSSHFLMECLIVGRHVKFKENVFVCVLALEGDKLLSGCLMCCALDSAFAVRASIPSFGVRGYVLVSCHLSFHSTETCCSSAKGTDMFRHIRSSRVLKTSDHNGLAVVSINLASHSSCTSTRGATSIL
jgi:hypothetical protein